ncbi:MAG: ComEC/Rec2 family competence protein [Mangrovibacterium sp.]
MMCLFRDNPIIKLLLFWVMGIVCARKFTEFIQLVFFTVLLLSMLSLVARRMRSFDFNIKNLLSTWSIAAFFMLISALNYQWQSPKMQPLELAKEQAVIIQQVEPLVEKTKTWQGLFKVLKSENDSLLGAFVQAYVPKQNNDSIFRVGKSFYTVAKLRRIKNKGNPYEFDYAGYMQNKGIYYSCYLLPEKLQEIASLPLNMVQQSELLRQRMLHIYQSKLSEETYPLVAALVLGYRENLDAEQKSYFQGAGISHILAVSGLHVGIVCAILAFLLKPIKTYRSGKWIYVVLLLLGIWSYAVLTGLSPSVRRSAFMFSIFMLAYLLNRPNAIHSSIALSALVLLIISPNLLFDVSFQLSYAAVIAIVAIQPKLDELLEPKSKLGKWGWGIITVSLAAQLGTLPFTLYYFHQFPIYFLPANLLAIPVATFILCIGLIGLFLSSFGVLSAGLFAILQLLAHCFVQTSQWLSNLPYAMINDIVISDVALALLLCLSVAVMLWIYYRRLMHFNIALTLLLLAVVDNTYDKLTSQEDVHILHYKHGHEFMQLAKGSEHYIVYNDSVVPPVHLYRRAITALRLQNPMLINLAEQQHFSNRHLLIQDEIIQFQDTVFVFSE